MAEKVELAHLFSCLVNGQQNDPRKVRNLFTLSARRYLPQKAALCAPRINRKTTREPTTKRVTTERTTREPTTRETTTHKTTAEPTTKKTNA
ncbi:GD22328 [Drosophila simulans]|uniref:GD22328 n=1 Tax=Drosophila simulans TaxID=7240 RepID=B4Q891_DROSI|nr:GD22328 [Drosophila simulans]